MDALTQALEHSAGAALLTALVAAGLALIWALFASVQVSQLRRRLAAVLQGAKGENLERMLYEHLKGQVKVEDGLASARTRLDVLEKRADSSKRFIGIVRFDAFQDIGGHQSFALAVFDDLGNGAVLSSLVGRSDARVYCKPLRGGRSEIELSTEEKRAIELARAGGPGGG